MRKGVDDSYKAGRLAERFPERLVDLFLRTGISFMPLLWAAGELSIMPASTRKAAIIVSRLTSY